MSTTVVTPIPAAESNDSSAHITTTVVKYRTYGAFDENGKAKNVKRSTKKDSAGNEVEEISYEGLPSVLSETQTGKNWNEAEKRGAVVLAENDHKFYTLNDLEGFETLVPSAEQRLYVIQKGMDAIQTAAANQAQMEFEEKNSKDDADVFVNNGVTIDLREALNTPPKRKNLTDEEKFMKAVGALPQDKVKAMLAAVAAQLQQQL